MDPTLVGLIIGIVLVIIVVLLIFMGRGKENAHADEVRRVAEVTTSQPMMVTPAKMDDLTLIEGIGPKIAELLKRAGITTFAQLAATDVPFLDKLLKENGLQFTKPQSWAEQARLAAEGKMDELKALQAKLVAGR